MITDRILQPDQVAGLIRAYLSGSIDGSEASLRALRMAGSMDRILAGHQTRVIVSAYWALRRLAESEPTRPTDQEMTFLLDCVEGRRRFPQDH